jgi:hypothetical protein
VLVSLVQFPSGPTAKGGSRSMDVTELWAVGRNLKT